MEILTIILTIVALGVIGFTIYNTINNYLNLDRILSALQLVLQLVTKPKKLLKLGVPMALIIVLATPFIVYGIIKLKMFKCPYCTTFWASMLLLSLFSPLPLITIVTYSFCSMFTGAVYNLICFYAT